MIFLQTSVLHASGVILNRASISWMSTHANDFHMVPLSFADVVGKKELQVPFYISSNRPPVADPGLGRGGHALP